MKTKYGLVAGLALGLVAVAGYAADVQQPKERYESKILIEGKWGDKPGEYEYSMNEGNFSWPRQFAVDDKENVYIVDALNNRVQHYDADGKLVAAIPLRGVAWLEPQKSDKRPASYSTRTIAIDRILFSDGAIYVVQSEWISKGKGYGYEKKNVFVLKGKHFVGINGTAAQAVLEQIKPDPFSIEGLKKLKELFKNDAHFRVGTARTGMTDSAGKYVLKTYDIPIYNGQKVSFFFKDNKNNLWVHFPKTAHKYTSDGVLLAEIAIGDEYPVVAPDGEGVYSLVLSTDRPGNPQNLGFDDYKGIRIKKYTLVK